jgi:hypothetical protein
MRKPGYQRGVVLASALLALSLLIANTTMAVKANVIDRGREGYYHVVGEDRYVSIVPWVKAYTSPQSVFMWAKPSLRFLWTERKAVDYPRTRSTEDVLHSIRQQHINYVVVDSFSDTTQRHLHPAVQKYPEYFSLVYKDGVSEVYRVVTPDLNARTPAGG